MKNIKALFSDKGSISMMRVMSLICILTASCIAFIGISKASPDYSGLSLLCSTFLAAGFAGKAYQKQIETKTNL